MLCVVSSIASMCTNDGGVETEIAPKKKKPDGEILDPNLNGQFGFSSLSCKTAPY